MILESTVDLIAFVKSLRSECWGSYDAIEMSTLEECFARSQGLGSIEEFSNKFPILLDCTRDTSKKFIDLFEESNSHQNQKLYILSGILERSVRRDQWFPVAAHPRWALKIRIFWEDGHISRLYEALACYDPREDDYYKKSTSYVVSARVNKDEYNKLCETLKPLINVVVNGYEDSGYKKRSSFSEEANDALKMITQTISDFEFAHHGVEGVTPEFAVFGPDPISARDVDNDCLKKIHVDGRFIFDHSFSDVQLRQVVAAEIINGLAVSDDSLFDYFQELRDACRDNYLFFNGEHSDVTLA